MPNSKELYSQANSLKNRARNCQEKEGKKRLYANAFDKYKEILHRFKNNAEAAYEIALLYKKHEETGLEEKPGKNYAVLILRYLKKAVSRIQQGKQGALLDKILTELENYSSNSNQETIDAENTERGVLQISAFEKLSQENRRKYYHHYLIWLSELGDLEKFDEFIQQGKWDQDVLLNLYIYLYKNDATLQGNPKALAMLYQVLADQAPEQFRPYRSFFMLSREREIIETFDLNEVKNKTMDLYVQAVIDVNEPAYLCWVLNWLCRIKIKRDDIADIIEQKLRSMEELNQNIDLIISLTQYFFDSYPEKAISLLEIVKETPVFFEPKYRDSFYLLCNLYSLTSQEEKRVSLEARFKTENPPLPDLMEEILQDERRLIGYIDDLAGIAKKREREAMHRLHSLLENENTKENPYVYAKVAEVLEVSGKLYPRVNQVNIRENPFAYVKNQTKDQLEELKTKARELYEKRIKEGDLLAYEQVANWRLSKNELFEQNVFLARRLYEITLWQHNNTNVRGALIQLYFSGEGGLVDIDQIQGLLSQEEKEKESGLGTELSYIYGEIFLCQYYQAKHDKRDHSSIQELLNQAEHYFNIAAEQSHKKARLSLEILNEEKATHDRAQNPIGEEELSQQEQIQMDSLQWQDRTDFLDFSSQIDVISSRMEVEEEGAVEGTNLSNSELERANELLFNQNDARLMRKIAEKGDADSRKAFDVLLRYYREKGEVGLLNLISTLCYESFRHNEESTEYNLLKNLIIEIDNTFDHCSIEGFRKYLRAKEEEKGDYFDEYYSDDSDDEVEDDYQAADHAVTADHDVADEVTVRLEKIGIKLAQELKGKRIIQEEVYEKFAEKIRDNLHALQWEGLKPLRKERGILEDVRTLNHYSAQDRLGEALELVDNHYRVAQTRGIFFDTGFWNQSKRRTFKELVKRVENDETRPLHNKPLCSLAVYTHAEIEDFTDTSEKTLLRLEKSARFIQQQLRKLIDSEPYGEEIPERFHSVMLGRKFHDKRDQIQQLYSNNMDLFLDFIKWESSQEGAIFPNQYNPFVSTGDIQSFHSARYAHNKAYTGHEQYRLRPQYGADGKAHRTVSGAMALIICPLVDYLHDRHNHVPAMNSACRINIQELIVREREATFFTQIPADRVKFWYLSKYPSFHRREYYPIFHFKYGITKKLYFLLRDVIQKTRPHTYKRRLVKLLIDEYLSAYRSLYAWRHAHKKLASRNDWALLYRDRHGNFSLDPTFDISPFPAGGSNRAILRRFWTQRKRREVKGKENLHKKRRINTAELEAANSTLSKVGIFNQKKRSSESDRNDGKEKRPCGAESITPSLSSF